MSTFGKNYSITDIYLIITVLLVILAVSDLMVGVSNDAVNFLNSAIGSKVTSRKVILLVASTGILLGATFSSGMMEIARKGIFNPQYFYFSEIMIIFLAVMLTDILLLDVFNTFGLPTSTTVSIVFELLGAATIVALLKIVQNGEGIQELATYLNSSQAILIISGIFISIGIAFFIGCIIQFLSRWLFSFKYKKRIKYVGSLWSAIAFSCLTFFLLFKGLKGASFVSENVVTWINAHTAVVTLSVCLFWFLFSQVLISFTHINILRLVVLFGTFSLAMAFSGNDLVNFIGVPIAGIESYQAWVISGIDAQSYSMEVLSQPVRTNTFLLLIGGVIMVLTLWFSGKAQTVTETEVNLGRQDIGRERFRPNILSRVLVRQTLKIGKILKGVMPASWLNGINHNFINEYYEEEVDGPAFDLVRASVNLTVAAVLIAIATSLKLPLSTTYVSFMVAMGTSLADRAWGRDTAVYRIAGVLNVIGGWLMTAVIAFIVSGIFAFLMIQFGLPAIFLLVGLVIIFILNTYRIHRKELDKKDKIKEEQVSSLLLTKEKMERKLGENIMTITALVDVIIRDAVNGLLKEKRKIIIKSIGKYEDLKLKQEILKDQLYTRIKNARDLDQELISNYILAFDHAQDVMQSVNLIVHHCYTHVENSHYPFEKEHSDKLWKLIESLSQYLSNTKIILNNQAHTEDTYDWVEIKNKELNKVNDYIQTHILDIQNGKFNPINGELYLTLLLEIKDLLVNISNLYNFFPHGYQVLAENQRSQLDTVN